MARNAKTPPATEEPAEGCPQATLQLRPLSQGKQNTHGLYTKGAKVELGDVRHHQSCRGKPPEGETFTPASPAALGTSDRWDSGRRHSQ